MAVRAHTSRDDALRDPNHSPSRLSLSPAQKRRVSVVVLTLEERQKIETNREAARRNRSASINREAALRKLASKNAVAGPLNAAAEGSFPWTQHVDVVLSASRAVAAAAVQRVANPSQCGPLPAPHPTSTPSRGQVESAAAQQPRGHKATCHYMQEVSPLRRGATVSVGFTFAGSRQLAQGPMTSFVPESIALTPTGRDKESAVKVSAREAVVGARETAGAAGAAAAEEGAALELTATTVASKCEQAFTFDGISADVAGYKAEARAALETTAAVDMKREVNPQGVTVTNEDTLREKDHCIEAAAMTVISATVEAEVLVASKANAVAVNHFLDKEEVRDVAGATNLQLACNAAPIIQVVPPIRSLLDCGDERTLTVDHKHDVPEQDASELSDESHCTARGPVKPFKELRPPRANLVVSVNRNSPTSQIGMQLLFTRKGRPYLETHVHSVAEGGAASRAGIQVKCIVAS